MGNYINTQENDRIFESDVKKIVDSINDELEEKARLDGFKPFEDVYRIGDCGYVTEQEYEKAFENLPAWAKDAYLIVSNMCYEPMENFIVRLYNVGGLTLLDQFTQEMFDNGYSEDVYYTETDEEGNC